MSTNFVISDGALIMVTVHILAEKSDLFDAIISQVANFIHDGGGGPVPLATPYERHYTKAAHVITASHNANPGVQGLFVATDR